MTNAVCFSCKNYNKETKTCETNMPLAPYSKNDCWRYQNKHENSAIAEGSPLDSTHH